MPAPPVDPFVCPPSCGRHSGDLPDFDHYCDALNVREHELPHAFAAWLANKTGWDGRYESAR